MKRLSILGSTGSIGVNTLDVVRRFPGRFSVKALSAGGNLKLLQKQISEFKPSLVSVQSELLARKLEKSLPRDGRPEVVFVCEGLGSVAAFNEVDLVVSALVGSVGLMPTLTAIKRGKQIALANKETLVMAGKIVMDEARTNGVTILPVDSEHCALFQLLSSREKRRIEAIVLTASGGPFLGLTRKQLSRVTPEDALKHPNWKMGKKVTVDSASLMNKGMEVIEARWLFDIPLDKIKVVIHPQSIVHGMVEYSDGSVIAHLSNPDMRGPIAYALSYPRPINPKLPSLNLIATGNLNFKVPHYRKFPSLYLAYRALEEGGTMPAVLNAANEVAVSSFLNRKIAFTDIPAVTRKTMDMYSTARLSSLEDVIAADGWARRTARAVVVQLR